MSLTSTTLSRAVTAIEDAFPLTSVTGLSVGHLLKVNSEYMQVEAVNSTTSMIQVRRGHNATFAVAHNILSIAVFGAVQDWHTIPAARQYDYNGGGAITAAPGTHVLLGTTAAFTLRAPYVDEEGLRLQIVSGQAVAYTVTLDSGTFDNDGLSSELNFSAAIGNAIELIVAAGYWCRTSKVATVTLPSRSPSKSASISPSKSPSNSTSVSTSPSSTPSVSPSKSPSVSPSASS